MCSPCAGHADAGGLLQVQLEEDGGQCIDELEAWSTLQNRFITDRVYKSNYAQPDSEQAQTEEDNRNPYIKNLDPQKERSTVASVLARSKMCTRQLRSSCERDIMAKYCSNPNCFTTRPATGKGCTCPRARLFCDAQRNAKDVLAKQGIVKLRKYCAERTGLEDFAEDCIDDNPLLQRSEGRTEQEITKTELQLGRQNPIRESPDDEQEQANELRRSKTASETLDQKLEPMELKRSSTSTF